MFSTQDLIKCHKCKILTGSFIIIPCGESLCLKCAPTSSTFNCDFCGEIHSNRNRRSSSIRKPSIFNRDCEILEFRLSIAKLRSNLENYEIITDDLLLKNTTHCSQIINEINNEADQIISNINSMRNDLISKVKSHEFTEINSIELKSNLLTTEINNLITKSNNISNPDDLIMDKVELYRSILSIETKTNSNFDDQNLTYKKSQTKIESDILGLINQKSLTKINFKDLRIQAVLNDMFKPYSEDSEWLNSVKNIQCEKLQNGNLVTAYMGPNWSNVYVHNLNDKLDVKKVRIPTSPVGLKCLNDEIYLFFDSKIIKKFDYKNVIFTFKPDNVWSEKNKFLNLYDTNLNYLASCEINKFLQIPKEMTQNGWAIKPRALYMNEKYYFIRWPNMLCVVSIESGRLVKTIELSFDFHIIRVTDENVIIAELKKNSDWKILFIDFDGVIREEYVLDEFPDEVKLIVDDNLNLEVYDPIKMISYHLNSN
ncbi:unnamed protein product [Brachionus calyciflorus]|uniref:Uncharacterized protein n=1 Tax=Brachionus calyciflorus TaxID=104777 RepID=A0A813QG51_9BILA|nr:unnamed protein product [Brachionus calyciflorus]